MSVRPASLVAVGAAALATAVAGCGGGGSKSNSGTTPAGAQPQPGAPATSSAGGGHTLRIKADPSGQLKFNVSALQASAGKVRIVMANPSQLSHSVAIEGNGVNAAGQVVGPGGTSTVSANLKPGTYTFFCTVPGHRQAGMQGTLTVK
jgi:uncharacterized cupredoxin-like copper-binding protein